jgi:hypothetical protein
MVLESIFLPAFVERNKKYSFFLGIVYAFIAQVAAYVLFPENFIIVAVAFTSLLLLPLINKLLESQKNIEASEQSLSVRKFYRNHKDIFQVYFFIFMGIFFSFIIFSLFTPLPTLNHLFANQEIIIKSIYRDDIQFADFYFILSNNIKVLVVAYLAAYFLGTGAVFIISWNASVWGTIFGAIANNAAVIGQNHPLIYFFLLSLVFIPHLVVEASAYLLAGISGGIVSKAVSSEKATSLRFERVIKKSMIILWISLFLIFLGAVIESQIAPFLADTLLWL